MTALDADFNSDERIIILLADKAPPEEEAAKDDDDEGVCDMDARKTSSCLLE